MVLVRITRQVESLESSLAKANDQLSEALAEYQEQKKALKYMSKPYSLANAEEAVEDLIGRLEYAQRVALAFIMVPSVDQDAVRDRVASITDGARLSEVAWDRDGRLVVGQHTVELPSIGGESPGGQSTSD